MKVLIQEARFAPFDGSTGKKIIEKLGNTSGSSDATFDLKSYIGYEGFSVENNIRFKVSEVNCSIDGAATEKTSYTTGQNTIGGAFINVSINDLVMPYFNYSNGILSITNLTNIKTLNGQLVDICDYGNSSWTTAKDHYNHIIERGESSQYIRPSNIKITATISLDVYLVY